MITILRIVSYIWQVDIQVKKPDMEWEPEPITSLTGGRIGY